MKIQIKVPATTANLGPGFDTLGLALNLWNEAVFSVSGDGVIKVKVEGEGQESLPSNAENAVAQAALSIDHLAGKSCPGLQIDCRNRVPLGSGLGSSSAAILAGMLGANALLGSPFTGEEILQRAIESEGHPDNLAPAMWGGLVVSIADQGRVISRKLPFQAGRGSVHATFVLPEFGLPTSQARAALPDHVTLPDAVHNIGRTLLVAEALRTGDMDSLRVAMQDRLHQPHRLPLIPGAVEAIKAGEQTGAAAVVLSGAGPGLIAFSSEKLPNIGAAMQQAFASAGLNARIYYLEPVEEGAQVNIL
jgi:homoserine kinase